MEEAFRQKLMDAAYKADRSLNAEIMARLEKSFEDDRAANELAERVSEHDGFLDDHAKQLRELWVHIDTLQGYATLLREDADQADVRQKRIFDAIGKVVDSDRVKGKLPE